MKHFIILRAIDDCDVSVAIEDITSIHEERNRTVVTYGPEGKGWNVKDSVANVVKRINEVNNNLK